MPFLPEVIIPEGLPGATTGHGTVSTQALHRAYNKGWPAVFYHSGVAVVGQIKGLFPIPWACDITAIRAAADIAPTGSSMTLDLLKGTNGSGRTSLFSGNAKPVIAAGNNTVTISAVPNTVTLSPGDFLIAEIETIGSTVAGSEITLAVWLRFN